MGTILIPDISGFTRFVNATDTLHSSHIIGELLQIIVDAFNSRFEVSEIEGDAVLLYRLGEPLSWDVLEEQLREAFYQFHGHINLYKRDVICSCGACSTAANLSLKFIIHYGGIGFYNVSHFKKLIGSDIIVAHRLLKNGVKLPEYILVSEQYRRHDRTSPPIEREFLSKSESLEGIGSILYYYKNIEQWLVGAPVPAERNTPAWYEVKPYLAFRTNTNAAFVVEALTDPVHRMRWMKGVKAIRLKGGHQINRIKTVHECILPIGSLTVQIQDYKNNDNEIVLVENSKNNKLDIDVNLIYRINFVSSESCDVSLGFDFQKSSALFQPLKKTLLKLVIQTQIKALQKYLVTHQKSR